MKDRSKSILEIVNNREIITYLIVGVLTTIVSLAVYYALVLTILDPYNPFQLQVANVVSWIAAVSFAYVTNRKYVFQSESEHIIKEAALFFCSRLSTLLIDMGMMFLMVTAAGINDKISKLAVQIVITIANYLFSKFFVFRE